MRKPAKIGTAFVVIQPKRL